jgi:CheY-like chemotaxis protein
VAANDGAEALERAASLRPDLITLDVSMPDASGATTYEALRNDSLLCHVPVIVITAVSGAKRSFTKDVRLGRPTGFLAKPIDLPELGRLVKRLT